MDKFQNKYRIPSARLQNWDYGWNGAYFLTICTKNREHFFGEIFNGQMEYSEIGKMVNKYLMEIPQRFEYAKLDEFILMPNHVHAIIVINKIDDGRVGGGGGDGSRDAINRVSTGTPTGTPTETPSDENTTLPIQKRGGITSDKNPMLHNNVSRIMNWFTGRVTYESRKFDKNYGWQSRFYDHLIRNDSEHQRIKNYIINNPKNWGDDKFYN